MSKPKGHTMVLTLRSFNGHFKIDEAELEHALECIREGYTSGDLNIGRGEHSGRGWWDYSEKPGA